MHQLRFLTCRFEHEVHYCFITPSPPLNWELISQAQHPASLARILTPGSFCPRTIRTRATPATRYALLHFSKAATACRCCFQPPPLCRCRLSHILPHLTYFHWSTTIYELNHEHSNTKSFPVAFRRTCTFSNGDELLLQMSQFILLIPSWLLIWFLDIIQP